MISSGAAATFWPGYFGLDLLANRVSTKSDAFPTGCSADISEVLFVEGLSELCNDA